MQKLLGCLMVGCLIASAYAETDELELAKAAKDSRAVQASKPIKHAEQNKNSNPSDELAAKLGKIKSMEANFKQTIFGPNRKKAEISYGQLWLKKHPSQFKWVILQGQRGSKVAQQIISDGKILWNYDVDLEQVTKGTINLKDTHTPAALLSGDANELINIYNINKGKQPNEYQLIAKSPKQTVDKVDLKFGESAPEEMVLHDKSNQVIEIKFSEIKANPEIPNTTFEFNPPKGVEVLTEQKSGA